jgi:hypothetical protein
MVGQKGLNPSSLGVAIGKHVRLKDQCFSRSSCSDDGGLQIWNAVAQALALLAEDRDVHGSRVLRRRGASPRIKIVLSSFLTQIKPAT